MKSGAYKKKSLWLFACFVCLSLVVVSRDSILAKGSGIYLKGFLQKKGFSVDLISSEKNATVLQGLTAHGSYGDLSIEEVKILWHLSLFPLKLQPTIAVIRPSLSLLQKE